LSEIGAPKSAELRLAFARHKLRAIIREIERLETSEFPIEDGREALAQLARNLQTRFERLNSRILVTESTVSHFLAQVNVYIETYMTVLGFILRSTNVRNSFESYFPLQRLVKQIISPNAKLIISAEWDYIPFTYPMSLRELSDYVLIGGPVPEADNVLILPFAGHEIGHSAWKVHAIQGDISLQFVTDIEHCANLAPAKATEIDRAMSGRLVQHCFAIGLRQIEEIYCDFVGMLIFGESYLYAFEYLLSPGMANRSLDYPNEHDRIYCLKYAAEQLGINARISLFDGWQSNISSKDEDFVSIMDAAVRRTSASVWQLALDRFTALKIPRAEEKTIERVLQNFRIGVPDGEGASLAEIITAGWRYVIERNGMPIPQHEEEFSMLNELMLKSIEVSEYNLRVSGG